MKYIYFWKAIGDWQQCLLSVDLCVQVAPDDLIGIFVFLYYE